MPDILDKDQVPLGEPHEDFNLGEWVEFNLGNWLTKETHQLKFVQGVVDSTLAQVKKDFSTFGPNEKLLIKRRGFAD